MTVSNASERLRRYSRHLLIPEVGLEGQRRLGRARVLVVGAGGLGTPVLQYLAAAGIGRLGIVDDDVVDETNLQRQVIYATSDVGRGKAVAAAERVVALNPHVAADPYHVRFTAANARDLVRAYDIVVDATDTFESRYLVNDATRLEGKPNVYGSIFRFDGQVTVLAPGGPCYRCIFPEPPPEGTVPTCAEGGVLGVLAGIVGTWQAVEALKLVLGIGKTLEGRLLVIDALDARVREFELKRDPECALCGDHPAISDVVPLVARALPPLGVPEIAAAQLDEFLEATPEARVLDVREPHEAVLGAAPHAVVLPASELEARMHELDSARTYVVACRVGAKSRWAAQRLHDAGFRRLYHLKDGLLAYAAGHDDFGFF
ncbi:MAG: molybdopterin-synthase adenylyltransferase MoeB [Candidatus Eremiobacteraeota bacterium]|nr:molybdopterin-synthase adenylyltransferase MoeB [Candidatus Eremiobacteraeota bacterium]